MKRKVISFLNRRFKTPVELDLTGVLGITFLQIVNAISGIVEIEICRQLLETLFFRKAGNLYIFCTLFICMHILLSVLCLMTECYTAKVRGKILMSLTIHILRKNKNLRNLNTEGMNENDKISIADGDCERYTDRIMGMTTLFSGLIATVCYIVYGFTINVWITLLIIAVSIWLSALNKKNQFKLYKYNEELNDSYGFWSNFLWKAFDNLEVIKVFLAKEKIITEQKTRNDNLCEVEQKSLKTYLDVCLIEESSDMMFTIVILCLSFFAILNHQMSAASILAIVEALTSVQKNILKLPEQVIRLNELESMASRIYKFNSMEEDNATREMNEDFYSLTMNDIYFNYQEDKILNGINYVFQKGKFYIIAGPSGCGKSTFLKILARLLPVKEGAVYWNEKDLSTMTRDSVYEKVSYVSQNKVFLEDTIRENVCLKKPDAKVYKKVVEETFLQDVFDKNQCADDLSLVLNGWPLSSGERQMVAFANVLYEKKQLILLDEVFSAVDPVKEKHFYECLKELAKNGSTIILVSHRLTNIDIADCILFMKQGNIKESGSLDELCKEKKEFNTWYNMNQEAKA